MKKLNSIQDIAEYLLARGEKLKGLSLTKIANIENRFELPLPTVYKEFLYSMGKGAGAYMRGSSVFYDELLSLKEGARELIDENLLKPLPDNAFVFYMHQGYQAAYFKTNEGDNPPVYYFSEGGQEKDFILKEPSLTDFFFKMLLMSYPEK